MNAPSRIPRYQSFRTFERLADIETDDCVIWTGSVSHGYGKVSIGNGRGRGAHVLALERRSPRPSAGLNACHDQQHLALRDVEARHRGGRSVTSKNWCWAECPHNEHRHCNVGPAGHSGDHAYVVTYEGRSSVVASWPGVNSKYQTGPDRQVQL